MEETQMGILELPGVLVGFMIERGLKGQFMEKFDIWITMGVKESLMLRNILREMYKIVEPSTISN